MATPANLSSVVRNILVDAGNKPQRMSYLWEQVQARAPELVKSKTHFKTAVIANMYRRDQLVKVRMPEASTRDPTKMRMVYALRLKGSGKVKKILRAQGLEVDFTTIGKMDAVEKEMHAAEKEMQ